MIGSNTTWTLPIANLGDAAATLGSLARDTLDAEIAAVETELATFDASDVETRDSTLQRRLKKFDELRGRTNLMAGALSFRADALLEKLIALESDVKVHPRPVGPDVASGLWPNGGHETRRHHRRPPHHRSPRAEPAASPLPS